MEGYTPLTFAGRLTVAFADLNHERWISHCRDLAQLIGTGQIACRERPSGLLKFYYREVA